MLYVYIKGHEYEYGVIELLKLFFFNEEIVLTSDGALVENQGLLIESYLYNIDGKYSAETRIKKNNELISRNLKENLEKVDIGSIDIIKKIKIGIKNSIYEAVEKISNVKVPWGILTGIRPTKIVHDLTDKGYSEQVILKILLEEYKLTIEKANLILDVAHKERKFIYPIDENEYSLYVSIPFCPTRCIYCSFPSNSLDKSGHLVEEYTNKLLYEIEKMGSLMKGRRINTVYIGGGTPTSIPVENLERIIKKIYSIFGNENIKEFTVEAGRPDTITEKMLYMLYNNNIKRISINPQTMNDNTLSAIGRRHSADDIVTAFKLAKKIGIDIINMDLIIGLPGEGIEEIKYTLEKILELNPENLTVHTMAVKRASKLKESISNYILTEQDVIEEMINITKKYAENMNMYPYYMYRQKQILGNFENVGYTKTGNECIYNILIMEERQTIIAVGAGGISKFYYSKEDRIERVPNLKNIGEYIKRIDDMVEKKKKIINQLT